MAYTRRHRRRRQRVCRSCRIHKRGGAKKRARSPVAKRTRKRERKNSAYRRSVKRSHTYPHSMPSMSSASSVSTLRVVSPTRSEGVRSRRSFGSATTELYSPEHRRSMNSIERILHNLSASSMSEPPHMRSRQRSTRRLDTMLATAPTVIA